MTVAAEQLARTAPVAVPRRRAVLTVVPVRDAVAPRAPFAAAVVSLLVAGLFGLLVLNTVLAKDAFRLHALQVEGRTLADQEQSMTREVEALRAPSALAEKAVALGMVQAGPPAFLRLPDGAVLGSAVAAVAPVAPEPAPAAASGADDAPADASSADEASTDEASTTDQTPDETTTDSDE